jgi:small subunit ribosomal protein S9
MTEKKTDLTQSMSKAVGRRKTATARVRIMPGKGIITVNDRELTDYFPVAIWQQDIMAPLRVADRDKSMDVSVKVVGGGPHGQAVAVRHGIARALVNWDETLKPILKAEGFLTRDSREKERKKFGRRKARRGHQWRKR